MRTRVKWSVHALLLWLLGGLAIVAIMLGGATCFGMLALSFQDRWMFGMPCVLVAMLAIYRVPMVLRTIKEILFEFPEAIRERRW